MFPGTNTVEISKQLPGYNSPFHKFLEPSLINVKSTVPIAVKENLQLRWSKQSFRELLSSVRDFLYNIANDCGFIPGSQNGKDNSRNNTEDLAAYVHGKLHSGIVTRAFMPMRLPLILLGRWPYLLSHNLESPQGVKQTLSWIRVLNYDAQMRSPIWIYFGLTSLFIFYVLIMCTLAFVDSFLDWNFLPHDRWADIRKTTFRENLVLFLLIWGCLIHSTVSSVCVFLNRKTITRSLNYWNVAVEELQLSDVRAHRRFLVVANLSTFIFLAAVCLAYGWWKIRFLRDGALLFGTLITRAFIKPEAMNNNDDNWELRTLGLLLIMYVVYASRAFLFLFCFKCRLLRSMFRAWNVRLEKYLQTNESRTGSRDKENCERILRDIGILFRLIKVQDVMFARVLQFYYAVQLPTLCFELYMLAQSGTSHFHVSNESTRGMDVVSALIALFQTVYVFLTVSMDGSYVGEEAALGIEVLRRHPVTPACSLHRKCLVYHLNFLYSQRVGLTGGKFFTIDRPFIVTVFGAVLTYFVIILQAYKTKKLDVEQ